MHENGQCSACTCDLKVLWLLCERVCLEALLLHNLPRRSSSTLADYITIFGRQLRLSDMLLSASAELVPRLVTGRSDGQDMICDIECLDA